MYIYNYHFYYEHLYKPLPQEVPHKNPLQTLIFLVINQHQGRYYHEYSMHITVERDSPTGQEATDDADGVLGDALRDLARWLYQQLETQYDWLTSPEAVDEALIAGGYTFTETGQRFG